MYFYDEKEFKDYVHSNTKQLIDEYGLLQKDKSGRGYICPVCGSGSGSNGTGMTLSEETGRLTCWSNGVCFGKAHPEGGCCGDLIDIIGAEAGITEYPEKVKYFCRKCGIRFDVVDTHRGDLKWNDWIGHDGLYPIEVKDYKISEQKAQPVSQNAEVETDNKNTNSKTDSKSDEKINLALDTIEKTLNNESGRFEKLFQETRNQIRSDESLKALSERGISNANPLLNEIGYVESITVGPIKQKPSFIFPTSKDGYIARVTDPDAPQNAKTAKPKNDVKNGNPAPDIPAFLIRTIKERDKKINGTQLPEPVFIVEGPMDALSIAEVGGDPVSLNGLGNGEIISAVFKKYQIKRPLILLLDNDEAGIDAQDKLYSLLKDEELEVESVKELYPDKDANECLKRDPETLKQAILDIRQKSVKEFEESFNRSQKALFESYLKDYESNRPIRTGFKGLDSSRFLDGGLRAGLYIIGAISSLGKTTITLEMADQIASLGNDVIFFSLEMDKYEIMGKSVSRYTLKHLHETNQFKITHKAPPEAKNFHRIHREFNTEKDNVIGTAIWEYFNDTGDHLRIVEGNSKKYGDIDADTVERIVKEHIDITGRRPVIFIDYLQLLKSRKEDGRRYNKTDKQIVDENVFKLKQVSRDYHIPVFGISSFNRDNYYEPVSMKSFKESGAIEYSSDVLIGLEYEYMDLPRSTNDEKAAFKEAMEQYWRIFHEKGYKTIRLKMLKNRNGRSGGEELFYYYPALNTFFEGNDLPDA